MRPVPTTALRRRKSWRTIAAEQARSRTNRPCLGDDPDHPPSTVCLALAIGSRLGQVTRKAYVDLAEVIRAERPHFPRTTRLVIAVKRVASKLWLELISLGFAHPGASALLAVLVLTWFYLFAEAEA